VKKKIRLVIARVLKEVETKSHYRLRQLLGGDAFYVTLRGMLRDYQKDAEIG
jgi:hypothetical protein